MSETREHSYTTHTEDLNPAPETTYAERARTLTFLNPRGVLSTQSKRQQGYPFGSTMPYALDPEGRPRGDVKCVRHPRCFVARIG